MWFLADQGLGHLNHVLREIEGQSHRLFECLFVDKYGVGWDFHNMTRDRLVAPCIHTHNYYHLYPKMLLTNN